MSLSHAQRAAMMLAAEQQGTQEQQPQKQQQQQRQQQQGRLPVARPLAQRQRVTFATGAAAVASGRWSRVMTRDSANYGKLYIPGGWQPQHLIMCLQTASLDVTLLTSLLAQGL